MLSPCQQQQALAALVAFWIGAATFTLVILLAQFSVRRGHTRLSDPLPQDSAHGVSGDGCVLRRDDAGHGWQTLRLLSRAAGPLRGPAGAGRATAENGGAGGLGRTLATHGRASQGGVCKPTGEESRGAQHAYV